MNAPQQVPNYNKDFPVSWDEIHRTSKALAWKLHEKGNWEGIIAVARGGLVPACIVARELNIRKIECLSIASYSHKNQGGSTILKNVCDEIGDGKNWLIIDDLVDTGNTFRLVRDQMPQAHYACVYAKPAGVPTVDTFITEVSQDTWIHLPWDLAAQYAEPIAGPDLKA